MTRGRRKVVRPLGVVALSAVRVLPVVAKAALDAEVSRIVLQFLQAIVWQQSMSAPNAVSTIE